MEIDGDTPDLPNEVAGQLYSEYLIALGENTAYRFRVREPVVFTDFVEQLLTADWTMLPSKYTDVVISKMNGSVEFVPLELPLLVNTSHICAVSPWRKADSPVPDTVPDWMQPRG